MEGTQSNALGAQVHAKGTETETSYRVTTEACGVWHHRNEQAIFIGTGNAEDQPRANLCGETEVD